MDMGLSYSMEKTPIKNIYYCTTGISRTEKFLLDLPSHIILQDKLTPNTQWLITYKFIGTAKYAQALKWDIPIVSIKYLYDITAYYKKYELRPFEGALFSTSGISDNAYGNYYSLLGCKYQPNVSIFIDFLVADDKDTEKYKFCQKYAIPTIHTENVFTTNYEQYTKQVKYDAKQLQPASMFFSKVFYLDPNLPKTVFNKLRRIIIENEGTRISSLTEKVDYLLTTDFEKFLEFENILYHYQYVFDCADSKALLFPEFYKVNLTVSKNILPDVVAVIDKSLGQDTRAYENKLECLGAQVKNSIDMRVTHLVSRKPVASIKNENMVSYKIVNPEWVDQCLSTLKYVKETKFVCGGQALNLKRRLSARQEREMLFQFTGLTTAFKAKAIKKLDELKIKYSMDDDYSKCTHLIMGQLGLSEKFFYGLVNGIWILRNNFIDDFEDQQNFDFGKYEWRVTEDMGVKEKKHVEAIRRWRLRIQDGGKKPFYQWKVKLYALPNKFESYKNLIEHGDGSITDKDDYTHVFVDKSYVGEVCESGALSADCIFSYLFK